MMSPECYYNIYIKDKEPEEILKRIKGIIKRITFLNNAIETGKEELIYPNYSTQEACERMYLEVARMEYSKYSCESTLTKKELKGIEFNNKLDSLIKIVFQIGGYPSPWTKYIVKVENNISMLVDDFDLLLPKQITKEDFITELKKLYIGEWKKNYTPNKYGIHILDGTGWELEFIFNDGTSKSYSGYNHCPYNFKKFLSLINIELDYELSAVVEHFKSYKNI